MSKLQGKITRQITLHKVAGRSDAASAPRTKRLPVPGMARTTPLPDRQALDMILDKLQKKDTYGVFAEPVDLEELPDYNDVIEHPMDFGTVKRKLARNAYRSFEQFEDDVFLICSNAMVYNAPDTVYFRQAHSIQELARKKFQELRDEGIPTENQVKSEQKVGPIPCNRGPIKKPVLRYSDDDLDFLTRKEQIKRPNAKISGADISFRDQVKKPVSRNSENNLSSSFHKERVKKPIFRNSENNLSSSFHGEQVKKSISRNSEDDRSSSIHQVKVRKAISRNSEDDRSPSFQQGQVRKAISRSSENDRSSSLPQQQVKKPTSRSSNDGLASQKTHVGKPVCRNGEDPECSLEKEPSENPGSANGEDLGLSPEKLVEEPSCRYRDDMDHSRQTESAREPFCRDGQDDLGDSCNEEIAKPFCLNGQDALGSNVSPATIVSAGDGSDGLSVSQANGAEPPESTAADGCSDKDISSPVDEVRSEKTDDTSARDYSAKPSQKLFVVDETRRKTYHEHEDQPSSDSDLIFDAFCAEPKELISVGLHAEHSYARSLARFAGSLGAQGWRIASERIQQTLPAEVRFGRGWVGEYEPPLPPILVMQDQLRSQTKRATNDQVRKGRHSSNACPPEVQPQRSECSKGASSSVLDVPAVNKMAGHRPFFQPPEAVRAHQMKKSDSSQSAQSTKGPGVHDMLSPNNGIGHPKPFFQSQEPVAPQPKNEATWVYHGRPGDAKFGTSEKSRQTSNIGFITKNEPVNVNGFAMNASSQNNISDHAKSMVPTVVPGQVNVSNRGFDASRNIFSAFPTAVRENQCIPSAPVAQSWISFGASSENKPTIVSPNFNDGNSGWKMPFANVRTCDETKISAVPQFFRQPVQVPRESPGQNKGLVIFPQLVQTDFSRSQGQSQWQGLVPHMQQKPNMDMLRPDLNIGFPSPGSPPARQSSGINLEAQQPDLALQL
ncbi:Bromodomain and PHD finger-containing protein 3 [Triticum urartu]|uniref:Bromodomain and PHD finger-containing protein 3 n=1 Tax=Triticum urartu TaxID=4572 RepID=M7YK46_TRIUA|nr:Bromodomain and PHD finger-containing protein 3 [Triticum urartu]